MSAIRNFVNGYRLINGTHLNLIVALINNLTGNGTPGNTTASTLSATGLATLSGGQTMSGARKNPLTTVAAAGTTQGTATAIAAGVAMVFVTATASTEGVKLPTAATGLTVQIFASPTVGTKVYAAAAGQKIGTATTATTAYGPVVKNTATTFIAASATQWYVSGKAT